MIGLPKDKTIPVFNILAAVSFLDEGTPKVKLFAKALLVCLEKLDRDVEEELNLPTFFLDPRRPENFADSWVEGAEPELEEQ